MSSKMYLKSHRSWKLIYINLSEWGSLSEEGLINRKVCKHDCWCFYTFQRQQQQIIYKASSFYLITCLLCSHWLHYSFMHVNQPSRLNYDVANDKWHLMTLAIDRFIQQVFTILWFHFRIPICVWLKSYWESKRKSRV